MSSLRRLLHSAYVIAILILLITVLGAPQKWW